jgi:GTPase Era involved in 16S rRNA processing
MPLLEKDYTHTKATRHRICGIVNGEDFQMILSDTPGIIKPAMKCRNP